MGAELLEVGGAEERAGTAAGDAGGWGRMYGGGE